MNDTPQGSEQPDPQDPITPAPPTPPRYAPPQYGQPPTPVTPPQHWQSPQGYPVQPAAPAMPTQQPLPVQPPPAYLPPAYQAPQPGSQQPPVPPYAQQPEYPQQPSGYGQQYGAPQHPAPQYPAPQYIQLPTPGPGEPFDGAATPDDLSRPLYGANIGQAFTRFFKNYATFSGRASRSEYWWTMLMFTGAWILGSVIINIMEDLSYSASMSSYGVVSALQGLFGLLFFVVAAGIFIPSLALAWRRLHDANLAGPLYLLVFVPIVGWIIAYVLLALPPKVEGRRFFRNM